MRVSSRSTRDRLPGSSFNFERVLSVQPRTKIERSTGLRGERRTDHRPFSPKIFLAIGARRLWTLSLPSLAHSLSPLSPLTPLPPSLRSLRELARSSHSLTPLTRSLRSLARSVRSVSSLAPLTLSLRSLRSVARSARSFAPLAPFARSLRSGPQSSSSDCEENFGAKRPMIVASLAPEPCRSFDFGPRLYAQHPFEIESAPW